MKQVFIKEYPNEFDIIKINESDDLRIGGIVLGVIRKY